MMLANIELPHLPRHDVKSSIFWVVLANRDTSMVILREALRKERFIPVCTVFQDDKSPCILCRLECSQTEAFLFEEQVIKDQILNLGELKAEAVACMVEH